ncbi:MAG: hypothetical protein GJ680_07805 [Alteromonadaceae bacterium]|nr:hypothetical protein [Alteromonadaceae bacterium]
MFRQVSSVITSKGSQAPKANCLADLHARRAFHQGQFFTPLWVVKGCYEYLTQWTTECEQPLSLLDNGMGSGAMFAFATPDKFSLYGNDIDANCVDAVSQDAAAAGFEYNFINAGVEEVRASNIDVAIINPAYGISLKHPDLEDYGDINTYGIYGPNTHALSHEYSLYHALNAAKLVFAVLPESMRSRVMLEPRTRAIFSLPANTFEQEGANVSTFVAIFAKKRTKKDKIAIGALSPERPWPALDIAFTPSAKTLLFTTKGVDVDTPSINLPVTGDNRVELHHHNRRLVLKFHCGLTQAMVENHLLVDPARVEPNSRRPRLLKYKGSGKYLLDVYLLQDNPHAAFQDLLKSIVDFGGFPVVSDTLKGYFAKLVKRHKRQMIPNRHTIQTSSSATFAVTAQKMRLVDPKNPAFGVFKKNAIYDAVKVNNDFDVTVNGDIFTLSSAEFSTIFGAQAILSEASNDPSWTIKHQGMQDENPAVYTQMEKELAAAGVNFLWPCQMKSCAELVSKPYGNVAGWQQGCGKSRLAMAIALVKTGNALITVEAGLVDEMIIEVNKLGFDASCFQVIDEKWDGSLKKINLVSYSRLRGDDLLVARKLRRRISTLICDEATILSNSFSLQSRAIRQVSPRRVFALSGTPIRNYPRNVLPMVSAVVGSGVAHQPYGMFGVPYLHKNLIHSASFASTGIAKFAEDFVELEWSVNEFRDTLEQGAKREVPRINNVELFREWLQGNLQRRLRDEPEFSPYASCPAPVYDPVSIKWDEDHFYHHLKAFVHFQTWFEQYKKSLDLTGQQGNLYAILAKLRGVDDATNRPHVSDVGASCFYLPVTSKQRACVKTVKAEIENGRKTIVFGNSPDVMKRLCSLAKEEGIENAQVYIGDNPPKQRAKIIKTFREGQCGVLFLSFGCGDKGLNLPQAKTVLLYDRSYSHETENQAIARTQRPDQTDAVLVKHMHLDGSIDSYKAQMVEFKAGASSAGLDYGENVDTDFYHIEHFINEFVERWTGKSAYEFVEEYNARAGYRLAS